MDRYKEGYADCSREWEKKIKEKMEYLKKKANYRTLDNPTGRIHFIPEKEDYQYLILEELLKKGE